MVNVAVPDVAIGVIVGHGCKVAETSPELKGAIDAAVSRAATRTDLEDVKNAMRKMLRHGSYRPSGRGKPASEYLLGAALEGRFPSINNLVDINNLISLEFLIPISLVDLDRATASSFVVRRGRAGESYVFNRTDQIIDLVDLLLVAEADGDVPRANPVKDSMATKLDARSTRVMAILYAPTSLASLLGRATDAFATALALHGGAADVGCAIRRAHPDPWGEPTPSERMDEQWIVKATADVPETQPEGGRAQSIEEFAPPSASRTFFPASRIVAPDPSNESLDSMLAAMADGLLIGKNRSGEMEAVVALRDEWLSGTELRIRVCDGAVHATLVPPDRVTYWQLGSRIRDLRLRLEARGLIVSSLAVEEPPAR